MRTEGSYELGKLVIVAALAMFAAIGCSEAGDGSSYQDGSYQDADVPCSDVTQDQGAVHISPVALQKGGGGGAGGGGAAGAAGGGARGGSPGGSPGGNGSFSGGRGSGPSGARPSNSSAAPTPPSRVSPFSSPGRGFYGGFPVFFYGDGDDGKEDGNCVVQYQEDETGDETT